MAEKKNSITTYLKTKYSNLSSKNKEYIKEKFIEKFGLSESSFASKVIGSHPISYPEFLFLEEIIEKLSDFEARLALDYSPVQATA